MRQASRGRALVLTAAAGAGLLVLLRHRPDGSTTTADPTALVVLAAAWVAWALTGYLLVGIGAAAAAHLRRTPRLAPTPAARLAPAVVRRLVAATVGASTAAAVVAASPAMAWADAPPPAPPVATAPPLDWPGLAATPAPKPAPAIGLVSQQQRRHTRVREELVVRPGDSLWSLTARRLGPAASTAAIAAQWPRLYAANRDAIGHDPNLIRPGQRLVLPAPDERTSR